MSDRVEIVGGSSFYGRITIVSDRFSSEARIDWENKKVVCRVTPLPKTTKAAIAADHWYVPRTARLVLFLLANLFAEKSTKQTAKSIAVIAGVIAAMVIPVAALRYYFPPTSFSPKTSRWIDVGAIAGACILVGVILPYYSRRFIAKWHGAEHKAIECYHKTGSVKLGDIAKESPVSPSCGGRLLLPIVIANVLLFKGQLLILIALELVLQVDHYIGWWNIPVFRQASYLLQKYVTTKEPDKLQLLTAQRAMIDLIFAHEKLALETETAQ